MIKRRRVFIVEDELLLALDLMETLERHGYDVIGHSPTGEEAVERMREALCDLVVMDIKLAGRMNGIEAAQRILQDQTVALIYLTAYSNSTTLEEAAATEPKGFLTKPYTEDELLTIIENALS